MSMYIHMSINYFYKYCLVQLYVSTFYILVSICFILVHCLVYYKDEFLQLLLVFVVS